MLLLVTYLVYAYIRIKDEMLKIWKKRKKVLKLTIRNAM